MEESRPVDVIRHYIHNFSLNNCAHGNQGYNRVLLQLFGYMGHGKSSLINSCKYVLGDGPYQIYAKAEESYGGVTTSRTAYHLTPTITIVDNRGCSTMNSFQTGEIYAQLGNFIPLNMKVIWPQSYQEMINRVEESEMDPNFTDYLVPVFVYSVTKDLAEQERQEIKTFLKNCRTMTGIYPLIILTNKTSGDFYQFEKAFKLLGAEQVMALENYTAEDHIRSRGRHTEVLKFLYNALEDVSFQMRERRNPKRERVDRKKFLLNYLHEIFK
ncbi:uncharacterized protein LOC134571059 [Pelobates fuscus]|uniref:uncharacterized protein LOC134571059 n=1 Tax=Pelobates fuscus TaxID=191477 RepID=UPI002FE44F8F